jgi:hypothetical protein
MGVGDKSHLQSGLLLQRCPSPCLENHGPYLGNLFPYPYGRNHAGPLVTNHDPGLGLGRGHHSFSHDLGLGCES